MVILILDKYLCANIFLKISLVKDEWQRNHKQREKKLHDVDVANERKFAELSKKEADLAAEEQRIKVAQRELAERSLVR